MLGIRIRAMAKLNRKKLLFLILATLFFTLGGYIFQKESYMEWLASLIVYLVGLHWVYAYIWKLDMHNHLGKIPYDPEGKHERVRFLSFVFGIGICVCIVII
jgi:hypothetical protein